ncbi:hypothetical protein FQ087_19910 [Sporosarcina sp. ANT_H38]|uniref:hypothetical protein n=1 Tax=Sporosarcina sp. ANT_H38 TaxID=2597358 RepID=UPI0011F2468C|nr:hypothetical protein [Sporosarcina sp. ANT_H38]KAA0944371.1 hypothetical protein FQ087_19910 [Sporosarcina sp. ANT_H38]
MKRMENLQENLKKLPKYTLNEEQKENISLALKREIKPKMRIDFVKPFIALTLICATVFALVLSSDSERNNWFSELRQSFRPQVELTTQQAKIFNLPHNNQEVTGIEDKVGMLFNEQFVAKDARRGAKMMLYFWGDSSELAGRNYRVEAKNTYNEEIVISKGTFDGFLFDENIQQIVTSFETIPTEGDWQLSFYVDDKLFEEFVIEVLPAFPKTENYTLINHPMELKVDEKTEIYIESSKESGKEIEVKVLSKKGNIISEHVFIQNGKATVAGSFIYQYQGDLKFPEQGTWTLLIDGEKTQPFKN